MSFLELLFRILPPREVYAHCDVPCGLYSPDAAQMAANTVAKMVEKIQALPQDMPATEATRNSFVRMVWTKEEHARICKTELLILWTDYFKPEHLEMFPDLHDVFWKAAKLCSKNKQEVNAEAAKELQEAVEKIAGMFGKAEEAKKK